jgi:hypothetical protein
MPISDDRPTSVLDRPRRARLLQGHRQVEEPPQDQAAARPAVGTAPTLQTKPVPRGWGSHEERRIMSLAAAAFLLLGLYAVVFVVLGAVVWD